MTRYPSWRDLRTVLSPEWIRTDRTDADSPTGDRRGVNRGRFLATNTEPVAVFLIGMRINRWRAVRSWLPVMFAMPPMLRELISDPASGLLGYRLMGGPGLRQVTLIQYWRRSGDIVAFARDRNRGHRPSQSAFWQRYENSRGAVGIWHEMYSVRTGSYQCVYGDMPAAGMGAITGVRPAGPASELGGYRAAEDPRLATTTPER